MRRRTLLAAASGALLAPTMSRAATSPVVLELFTSQGCSSCPPAEDLLGELVRRPDVVGLAWHVDYWDQLGWHDPYASHLATERQRTYATLLGEGLYTPALVIDGVRMVIGSRRDEVAAAMAKVAPPPVSVALARDAGGVSLTIGGAGSKGNVLLVYVDPEHETPVGGGENSGRRLREYNTVRRATPLDSWDGAPRTQRVEAPPSGMGVAVIVQDANLRVLGAATLPPSA